MEQMLQQMGGMQGLSSLAGPKALVSVKAGKMNYDGRMVTPDRRKGVIKIVEDQGGMKQFQWCDAETSNPIESFYVFPGDAKFEKVKQSKDRVYLLEMAGSQSRYFYWFQEEESDKDSETCKKIHNTLNGIAETTKATESTSGPQMTTQS
jgi:26S proteasome regulatory subunit N13